MILVTGGTGLVGSHLLFRLAQDFFKNEQTKKIRALVRDESRILKVKKLFDYYDAENSDGLFSLIEWFSCDVLDVVTLEEAFENVTEIYHCAAHVSFQRSGFTNMMKINREGTANIVNLALEKENIRLVYVSSTAAVCKDNENPTKPVVESNKWVQEKHTSKYSITKYSAEKEVWRGIEEGLNAVILNPSMILGAGNWDESSLTIFRTLDKGLKFYTNGGNAFVDARDIADIMLILMKSNIQKERFLVTGTNVLYKDFFEKVCAQMHKKAPSIRANSIMTGVIWRLSYLLSFIGIKPAITRETARSAQEITRYDSSKLISLFNFQFRPLEETIQNTIEGRIK